QVGVRKRRRRTDRWFAAIRHPAAGADDQVRLAARGEVAQRADPARTVLSTLPVTTAVDLATGLARVLGHETAAATLGEQAECIEEAHPHAAHQHPLTRVHLVQVLLGGVSRTDPPS